MSTQYTEVGLVLEETTNCTATKATSAFIWKCVSEFHGDNRHYFQRAV